MRKSLLIFSMALISLISCSTGSETTQKVAVSEPIPLTIYIDGMTCESCNNAVNTALGELEGVSDVEADYITGKVTLKWQRELVSTDVLLATIEKLGYKASLQPVGDAKEQAKAKLRIKSVHASMQ